MGALPSLGMNGHVPPKRVWFGGVLKNIHCFAFLDKKLQQEVSVCGSGLYVMCQQSFLEFSWVEGKNGLAPIVQKVGRYLV